MCAQGLGDGALVGLIDEVRQPTTERVAALESAAAAMRAELAELREFQRLQKEADEKVRSEWGSCAVP